MGVACRYRGVSKKKGKWEAKVMVNRKWKFRAIFLNEIEAALAYDEAVREHKPDVANSFVNFLPNGEPNRRDQDGKLKSAVKDKRAAEEKALKQSATPPMR